ncbi:GntR family transcriptional regulator [Catenulispora pinistramenti]|uniref:GntR family transcriptional regulator n=1 Tax=Catenulispora pinistramenti TaxID=2705254 RepID=UPI001E45FD96|nr:GntR family transcriptional regulator [Catenulispora pinistramenti]
MPDRTTSGAAVFAAPSAAGAAGSASTNASANASGGTGAGTGLGTTGTGTERGPALNLPRVLGHNSLREQVSHALRAALIAGELRPGVVYSAPVLAAGFGVSATPVREAMLDLAKEGLVEVVRNKGFRVTELSESDLDQFTEIRALIEVPVVTGLARTAPAADLAALRPAAEAIVTAAKARDLIAYVEADQAFHLALLGLSGNPHLVEVVSDLRNRSRLYGLPSLADAGVLAASAEEHVQLVNALIARDAPTVEGLMKTHLTHVRSIWAGRE